MPSQSELWTGMNESQATFIVLMHCGEFGCMKFEYLASMTSFTAVTVWAVWQSYILSCQREWEKQYSRAPLDSVLVLIKITFWLSLPFKMLWMAGCLILVIQVKSSACPHPWIRSGKGGLRRAKICTFQNTWWSVMSNFGLFYFNFIPNSYC